MEVQTTRDTLQEVPGWGATGPFTNGVAATPLRHTRNCRKRRDRGVAIPWSATGGGVASAPLSPQNSNHRSEATINRPLGNMYQKLRTLFVELVSLALPENIIAMGLLESLARSPHSVRRCELVTNKNYWKYRKREYRKNIGRVNLEHWPENW